MSILSWFSQCFNENSFTDKIIIGRYNPKKLMQLSKKIRYLAENINKCNIRSIVQVCPSILNVRKLTLNNQHQSYTNKPKHEQRKRNTISLASEILTGTTSKTCSLGKKSTGDLTTQRNPHLIHTLIKSNF